MSRLQSSSQPKTQPDAWQNADAATPPLRLAGQWDKPKTQAKPNRPDSESPAPLAATDPRWVLAHRTAEQMQGSLLSPERRQRLVRLGKVMGLTAFDANLVIAIVQDQARRGIPLSDCPAAGTDQLALVPGVRLAKRIPWASVLKWVAAILVLEAFVLAWFMWR